MSCLVSDYHLFNNEYEMCNLKFDLGDRCSRTQKFQLTV